LEVPLGNVARLTEAGVIVTGAALSQEDQDLINGLTPEEVSALISIKSKLTPGFIQRNLSGGAAAGLRGAQQQAIGIVF
jgi:hypothetical protein